MLVFSLRLLFSFLLHYRAAHGQVSRPVCNAQCVKKRTVLLQKKEGETALELTEGKTVVALLQRPRRYLDKRELEVWLEGCPPKKP